VDTAWEPSKNEHFLSSLPFLFAAKKYEEIKNKLSWKEAKRQKEKAELKGDMCTAGYQPRPRDAM
jgi:hypothetical protein